MAGGAGAALYCHPLVPPNHCHPLNPPKPYPLAPPVPTKKVRDEMDSVWRRLFESNYSKSLDHRSFYFKQARGPWEGGGVGSGHEWRGAALGGFWPGGVACPRRSHPPRATGPLTPSASRPAPPQTPRHCLAPTKTPLAQPTDTDSPPRENTRLPNPHPQ